VNRSTHYRLAGGPNSAFMDSISQHSESCEASVGGTIPGHGKPLRVLD